MALAGHGASFLIGANTVAELNSVTANLTGDSLDVTSFSSTGLRSFIAGLRGGTMSVSGFYVPSDTNGQAAMVGAWLAGTTLSTCKVLVDGTNGFSADAIVTAITTDATPSGTVNFSATLQLTGTISVVS